MGDCAVSLCGGGEISPNCNVVVDSNIVGLALCCSFLWVQITSPSLSSDTQVAKLRTGQHH